MSLSNWESETRAAVFLAQIGLETIPAAEAVRKRRRVSVGGALGMVESV